MKKAIIIIPEKPTKVRTEVVTNGINMITIINVLRSIESGLSKKLVEQAKQAVGDDERAQTKYLDMLVEQAKKEEEREGPENYNIQLN